MLLRSSFSCGQQIAHPSLPPLYADIYSEDPPTDVTEQPNGMVASPNDGGITPASMGRTPHQSGWTPTPDKPPSPILINGTTIPSSDPSIPEEKAGDVKVPRRAAPLDLS